MIKSYKISSSALVLVLSLYFGLVLNFGFWRFMADNLEISGWAGWVFLASLPFFIVVPLYLFFFADRLPLCCQTSVDDIAVIVVCG